MLGMSMMMGEGRPVFRVEINSNRGQWRPVSDAPQLLIGIPITLYMAIGPGVTVASTSYFSSAIDLFGLPNGSTVYLINNGQITGASSASGTKSLGGWGIECNIAGGRLFLDNKGWITAGTMVDGLSYAVYMAGIPLPPLTWISGASRITGSVYT